MILTAYNLILAYRLFDMDNDGEITPEELIQILTTVGESPGDLNMYFSGMSDGTITDYRAVVDWLTFCIKHGKFWMTSGDVSQYLCRSVSILFQWIWKIPRQQRRNWFLSGKSMTRTATRRFQPTTYLTGSSTTIQNWQLIRQGLQCTVKYW